MKRTRLAFSKSTSKPSLLRAFSADLRSRLSLTSRHSSPSILAATTLPPISEPMNSYELVVLRSIHSGTLNHPGTSNGIWFTREYLLVGNEDNMPGGMLFCYLTKEDESPVSIIVINHSFVILPRRMRRRRFVMQENLYGFVIVDDGKGPAREYFANSKQEVDQWILAFEQILHPRVVEMYNSKSKSASTEPRSKNVKLLEDIFEIYETIGEGGNSVVKRAVYKSTGKEVALKIIPRELYLQHKQFIDRETRILTSCNHRNIVKLNEVVFAEKVVALSMELLGGGELFHFISKCNDYTEEDAKVMVFSLLQGVKYLHKRGIVHGDLKPENMIFDRKGDYSSLKIVDFGLSCVVPASGKLNFFGGTVEYSAPEIVKHQPYDFAVDMWSCGVVVYALMCGNLPFEATATLSLPFVVCRAQVVFEERYWRDKSDEVKDFIQKLLEPSPQRRLTCDEALTHPWLTAVSQPDELPEQMAEMLLAVKRARITRHFRKVARAVFLVQLLRSMDEEVL
eukprot:c12764_g1_i1.p1 GENE.c12764_g1_i1~~c12764_g1_i1.p1  ORF type:complete len:510 (+),score=115.59 c12764_g1_i1:49-1578(+)